MTLKLRLKSYSFWVSLASAIFLLLKVLGQRLGFSVDEGLYNDIFTALCGILVICGIIAPPKGNEASTLPAPIKQNFTEQVENKEKIEQVENQENKDENLIKTEPKNQIQTLTEVESNNDNVFVQENNTKTTVDELNNSEFQNFNNQDQNNSVFVSENQIALDSALMPTKSNENIEHLQAKTEEASYDNCNSCEVPADCNQETFATTNENAGEDSQNLTNDLDGKHFELISGMDIPVSK